MKTDPKIVADPTFVTMARSALLAMIAIGLFVWFVVEACRAI